MERFFYRFRFVTCPSSPLTLPGGEAAGDTDAHKTRFANGDSITYLLPGVFTSTLSVDEINKVNLPGD